MGCPAFDAGALGGEAMSAQDFHEVVKFGPGQLMVTVEGGLVTVSVEWWKGGGSWFTVNNDALLRVLLLTRRVVAALDLQVKP